MAGYYYGQLSKEKKAVYDMLAAGCDALAAVIRVPDLGTEVLSDIYLRMKLDLPLLFFVTGFHYRKMPGADHVEVLPDYLFDRGKVKMHRQAVMARLERLARRQYRALAQELGVAEYDGKRRLELMRGVGHKLPLLLPGQLHGPDSPARQKETDGQKGRKAQHAYEQAVPDEAAYHVPLAGHVGKDDILLSVNRDTAVAQAVVFQDAGDITPGGLRGQRGKKIFVCQVVVSAFGRDNGALIVQFQNKVGQAHAFRRLSRTPGTQRVRGYALHHAKAFAL